MINYSFLTTVKNMTLFSLHEFMNAKEKIAEALSYKKKILRLCSYCIAPAPIAREFIVKGGGAQEQIKEVTFGLNNMVISVGHQNKERSPTPKNECFTIGYFGSLQRRKGLQVLIDAFCLIPETYSVALFISTNAQSVLSVFRCVQNKKIAWRFFKKGRIVINLNQANEEFWTSMGRVDLAVIPTLYYECTPLVLLEILVQRTPCLVTEGLGMSHIVKKGVSGDSFPPGNIEALRDRLISIVQNPAEVDEWRKNLYKPHSINEYIAALKPIIDELGKRRVCNE